MPSIATTTRYWCCLTMLSLAACAVGADGAYAPSPDSDLAVAGAEAEAAVSTQALQTLQVFSGATRVVSGSDAKLTQARSSVALRGKQLLEGGLYGTCGATFVSPHYAVTAGHCVKQLPLHGTILAEHVTVTTLNNQELTKAMTITGTDWEKWRPAGILQTGYKSELTSCKVVRRCGGTQETGPSEECPFGSNPNSKKADVALIHCPNRPRTDYAFTLAAVNAWNNTPLDMDGRNMIDVDVWWFHELYNLPTSDDGTSRWAHYGKIIKQKQNFHYQYWHQLLPFVSRTFSNGTSFSTDGKRQAPDFSIQIDTPICHGTSGGGVFWKGYNVLLGPVLHAGDSSDLRFGDRLCDDFSRAKPGQFRTRYLAAATTAEFVVGAPEIFKDR